MSFRFTRYASAAILALASAAPLYADGGQWSSRFWGLGWGDGYHAPPRTGGLHSPGGHGHGVLGHHASGQRGQAFAYSGHNPAGLMPGGYPDRGQYTDVPKGPQLPDWLWDPSEETVVVETAPQPSPAETDPVPPPPQSPAATNRAEDPSLGMPPALDPTGRTDSRAMLRRVPIQARSSGWSR